MPLLQVLRPTLPILIGASMMLTLSMAYHPKCLQPERKADDDGERGGNASFRRSFLTSP